MPAMQLVQFLLFAVICAAALVRHLVFSVAVVPALRRQGIQVPAPYYPWRVHEALRQYRRLCADTGESPRWWKILDILDASGLSAAAGLLVTAALQSLHG